MATAREIKRRIRSVKNIAQVTNALQAVSASRVRRAQARSDASRPYAARVWRVLVDVAAQARHGELIHPLLDVRTPVSKIGIVLITSDRGLAGPYNLNIVRKTRRFVEEMGKPAEYITVGRKGRDMLYRQGAQIRADFSDVPDDPTIVDIAPIAREAIGDFLSHQVDEVYFAWTNFINMLTQQPGLARLLPLKPYDEYDAELSGTPQLPQAPGRKLPYIYEPEAAVILNMVLPRFTEWLLFQAILGSQASEHAARMVAMRTASENADALADDLTLSYNKARQLAITSEMLDIVGGAEALGAAR
ncbi:MAG: ATP synthase F1 subunit gamma [Anaerolineae bacterium]|nr:ATP synthase F1 subunit gamma [Anaerolineae bacterium]